MGSMSERVLRQHDSHAAVHSLLERTLVSDLMVSPVRCAKLSMTRAQVARIMVAAEISAMPVVDDDGVVRGLVTKTDVVREDYGEARNAGAAGQVEKFMTASVLTLAPSDTLNNAVNLLAKAAVHHVVAVDEHGRAQGMLSSLDLMHWLAGLSAAAELEQEVARAVPELESRQGKAGGE